MIWPRLAQGQPGTLAVQGTGQGIFRALTLPRHQAASHKVMPGEGPACGTGAAGQRWVRVHGVSIKKPNLLPPIDELVECVPGDDMPADEFDRRIGVSCLLAKDGAGKH